MRMSKILSLVLALSIVIVFFVTASSASGDIKRDEEELEVVQSFIEAEHQLNGILLVKERSNFRMIKILCLASQGQEHKSDINEDLPAGKARPAINGDSSSGPIKLKSSDRLLLASSKNN